jgi:hypothetical protein
VSSPSVSTILGDRVTLSISSFDRLYLNGYVPTLQTPGQLVAFCREQLGARIASPDSCEQAGVVDAIEASFDIAFDDERVVGGFLCEVVHLSDSVMGPSSWPESVAGGDEIGFEDGLQDELESHLNDAVADDRDT